MKKHTRRWPVFRSFVWFFPIAAMATCVTQLPDWEQKVKGSMMQEDMWKPLSVTEQHVFDALWTERFLYDAGRTRIRSKVLKCSAHSWSFCPEFAQQFPVTTEALKAARSYRVKATWFGTLNREHLVTFWQTPGKTTLAWILNLPPSTRDPGLRGWHGTAMGTLWTAFGGFSRGNVWNLSGNDLPPCVRQFDDLLQYPALPIDEVNVQFFSEACDNDLFRPKIREMVFLGNTPSGNYLVLHPKSGLAYSLSKDEDFLKREGVNMTAVDDLFPVVYVIEGCEDPQKIMEQSATHILDQMVESQ